MSIEHKSNLTGFLEAYKASRNVTEAEEASLYTLQRDYPPSGFYVYALVDSSTGEIFYVGKGVGGRVLKHEERTKRGVLQNKAKVERIQHIFGSGHKVDRRILFCADSEEVVLAVEERVIRELASYGLTNIIGGVSVQCPKVWRWADDMRQKLDGFRAGLNEI